jgi:HAD superfamily hydrolase (TIGR01509 family)
MPALIFDCDGVLADTELYGHLPAFNRTFEEFGLPVCWTKEEYKRRLQIGGGKERMASLLTEEFVRAAGLPRDAQMQRELVARWHRRKTDIFTQIVARGEVPARPGVKRLAAEASNRGWTLAVASTSAPDSVDAVLTHAVGEALAARFRIFTGDIVPAKKPAPDIYFLALRELGIAQRDALAVEDSRNGLLAAHRASLRCIVTISAFTYDEPMDEALLVLSSLGDPGDEAATTIANRTDVTMGSYLTLDDLEACLISATTT